ncbi:zinc finger CCCH domain-containing protein 11A [Nematolebias whitei]|uniref:zinc finger CCCH domain-containing protein 11A n=1 Tax=Nematolebias whitei TaxID=451745 RepID=UPI00189AA3D5|nr:zinc finger CCCH domain-containing protein 11A [Nematolebias whitei]
MTNHGDDCYFYYYSTCTKGDNCPFRHCEAAMGNEIVCNLWQEGCCFRPLCKFRHMEITKNRKEIPCYWEKQPAGCQKPHCAFFHEKPRYIEGVFVSPSKSQNKNEEVQHEEPVLPPTPPLSTTANPQLRGVIKTDTQEPVPSPTHPPVVINPADDDEDEDDQFSEEGEEIKTGPSPKKTPKSGASLNFGVSTLEEIRLRKALKASMRKAGYPIQSAETSSTREKENIGFIYRTTLSESTGSLEFEPRVSVTERLGRKISNTDFTNGDGFSLKRRLGRAVDEQQSSVVPQKALKTLKERLGSPAGLAAITQPTDTDEVPELIHIKTLEEIKQEKAAKSQNQKDSSLVITQNTSQTSKAMKCTKRVVTVKDGKTSDILQAKKRQQDEQQPVVKKVEQTGMDAPGRNQEEPDPAPPHPKPNNVEKVRVKTLEEIRREKAARLQAQQAVPSESEKSSDAQSVPQRQRLLYIKKLPSQSDVTSDQSVDVTEKKCPAAAPQTTTSIKVKSFEEIMREKRLRKQEVCEQVQHSAETGFSQNQTGILKRKVPPKTSPVSSETTSITPPKCCKLSFLKPEAPSLQSRTASDPTAEASLPERQGSPRDPQSQSPSREVPDKNTSTPTSSARLSRDAQQAAEGPAARKSQDSTRTRTTQHPGVSKVRPKLNVRPSVIKPGPKTRGSESSAVAAVKPLNNTDVQEGDTCTHSQVLPTSNTEAQLMSALTRSPSTLDSGPPTEDLQTVPVFTQNQKTKPAVREFCTVPQSPVLKPHSQSRPRRSSAAARADASSSAVDDFEELINQFTDDHLEDDVDPAIGEDDLLQELSEMIDS